MFEKSLQDLVKGIRAHKRDPAAFVSTAIAECKRELKNVDPFVKAQAVRKLTYLQMLGYDVSWASFAIVETMSQPRFAHKRIGYLAACQCFCETTDVVLLTTNLLKKEFQSTSQYEVGLAVNCLANIVTRDLGRDLLQDCTLLMAHSKPYVRKKATSAMFKLFVRYPQGLRLTFDKLKARLDDAEPAVASCAVNVVCELANKNPNNYLAMAPQFFRLLTTSSNNWMLIKVVKLMGAISASRGAAAPSRRRRASSPGGLVFDFEAIRTALRDRDAPRRCARAARASVGSQVARAVGYYCPKYRCEKFAI